MAIDGTAAGAAWALLQVVLIDVTLAGDNAVVVGLAVAGLPAALRRRAIALGVLAACLIRIALSLVAVRLLAVIGLTFAGGILLLWVCWKMLRELAAPPPASGKPAAKSLRAAVAHIALADISMSLDNVLAVAGAARAHLWVMVAGLALSVLLMGVVADVLARMLHRYRWIGWLGLAMVTFVAMRMVVSGWAELSARLAWLHV